MTRFIFSDFFCFPIGPLGGLLVMIVTHLHLCCYLNFTMLSELLIRMMLGGGRGAASEGGLGAGINPYRRDRIYNLLVRIEKELKNKN